jgi:hypothetical protein
MSTAAQQRAARLYAERFGFAVFPCRPRGKEPLTTHGCRDASRNSDVIAREWNANPSANVAIATGAASGIFVLDCDDRHGGDQSLAALESRHGKIPETPIVLTPGPGLHIYLRLPEGVEIRNSAGALGPGLDIRAEGGYVIAPPSVHPNGLLYRWEASSRIDEVALAEPPEWLVQLIVISPYALRGANGEERPPYHQIVDFERLAAGTPNGERDIQLFRLACSLRCRGYSRERATQVVLDAASRCHPPFPARLAERKVASAWRYPS